MQKSKPTAYVFVLLAILSRLVPHPNNLTSTITAAVFSGVNFSRRQALLLSLSGLLLTDIILAVIQHHAIFGSWSLFTYSGLLGITLLAKKMPNNKLISLLPVLGCAFLFWLWTNFGCFLTMPEYTKNFVGLYTCFYLALPFLKNQLLGNVLWFTVLQVAFLKVNRWQLSSHYSHSN
jgi:hypothetical protein